MWTSQTDPNSPSGAPPEAWAPLLRLARRTTRPLERFLHIEAASGILLLLAAVLALIWANSPWSSLYTALWQTPLGIRIGPFHFERSLEWFINDALMVLFFFVVGMEIRRELHDGELSEWRRAALPLVAACGGMVVPALLYLSLAGSPATRSGWGVPMATDIAFALGVLTLLGKRVPAALRVLLLAIAVIDDLGAILVIAAFYSTGLAFKGLLLACAGIAVIMVMQRMGIRTKLLYVLPGVLAWAGIYGAGVHPTIAGVIVGLLTPVRAWLGPSGFVHDVQSNLQQLLAQPTQTLSTQQLSSRLRAINRARREAQSPAEALIEALHPWVAYAIMPLFALANAGVRLNGMTFGASTLDVLLGCSIGLLFGKPLGIFAASLLSIKLGLASLPRGLGLRHLVVLGVVAGIGFTMSLFIAQLAFTDAGLLGSAKLGVLAASVTAGTLSVLIGHALLPPQLSVPHAQTADEAETSTEL
ncbi:MAG: Na+/H+ antiporter NhaA [Myxococcales bacterium]|nr:Na+/H+ antiporter NhaA [Myxococcales bacterium]